MGTVTATPTPLPVAATPSLSFTPTLTQAVSSTLTQLPSGTLTLELTLSPTLNPTNTASASLTATILADLNPLTGMPPANPALLARRPLAIKVENLPRDDRPQWGLSLADLVFEYYTELGSTRFIALFYGNDAATVGPIRSARFFDIYVVEGYKAVFAYGYAYVAEQKRLTASDFANRLVIEGPGTPLRELPGDTVVVDTAALSSYITQKGVENGRQNLDGMVFNQTPPSGGQPVPRIYVRYSSAIYNRWDYDPASGKYLRFADTVDDFQGGLGEQYKQATDRLTNQPLAFDNMVVLYVTHTLFAPNIYDIQFVGSGQGYAFRDGQAYPVNWQRSSASVVSLTNPDGTPFPFKPGATWFEVVGVSSALEKVSQYWRFTQKIP